MAEKTGLEPAQDFNPERFSKPLQYQLCLLLHDEVKVLLLHIVPLLLDSQSAICYELTHGGEGGIRTHAR